MTLHHRLERDHEVHAELRQHPRETPRLSTIRDVWGLKVPGQILPAEAPDWVLVDASPAERRTLARLGFAFARHVEPRGIMLNTGNRTGGVEHEPEDLARAALVPGSAGGGAS